MKTVDLKQELIKLVRFTPVTNKPKNCKELLSYEASLLKDAGFTVKTGENNGHPYLLASNGNMYDVDVLLQAHIDVVPANSPMFRVAQEGDKLIGRGTYDMLFGTACFNKLVSEEQLGGISVGIMLTSDEEIGGVDGVGELIKNYKAKVCILPDAGSNLEICNEAKGVLQLSLKIPGKSGHGARPWQTDSPVPKIGVVVDAVKKLFPNADTEATTCSFTQVHAGEANNQVPSEANLVLDIRFQPSDDPEELKKLVEQTVKPFEVIVSLADVTGKAYAIDLQNPHVMEFLAVHERITGTKLGTMRASGSSDALFITPLGIPVIMTRPEGGGMHADDEWVSLSSLEQHYEVLKTYVLSMRKVY